MKELYNTLPKIVNSGVSEVSYNDDSLLQSLTKDKREPKKICEKIFFFPYGNLMRFVLLLTTIIVAITLVLTFTFIYIKDIVLFKSNLSVNREGVFMPSKSCGREYCLFLFNTSELWANTNIYLSKDDKYKISVSGAFHSSIEDMRRDADFNNPNLEMKWIGGELRDKLSLTLDSINIYNKYYEYKQNLLYRIFHSPPKMPDTTKLPQYEKRAFCVETSAYIGAVLYRIAPEYQLWNPDNKDNNIKIWNPDIGKNYQKVDASGVLTLAINDIYFKDYQTLDNYLDKYPIRFDEYVNIDTIKKQDKGKGHFKRMFYDDNVGQILVCLEIKHPLPFGFFNPLEAFRNLDDEIEIIEKDVNNSNQCSFYMKSLCPWIVFILHISIIFVAWILLVNVIMYIVLMLGYWSFIFFNTFLLNNILKLLNRVKTIMSKRRAKNKHTNESH